MTQQALVRPIGEFDFGDKTRFYPNDTSRLACNAREILKGRLRLREWSQLTMKRGQSFVLESGADPPRIDKLLIGIVVAEQKRPKVTAGARRRRIATDDELF